MNNILKISFYIILLLTACEKETVWHLQKSGSFPVVDALLTSELITQKIKVYYSSQDLNSEPEPVTNAMIKVVTDENEYLFEESGNIDGLYLSEIPFRCATGIKYELILQVNEIQDTAVAEMVAITPMQTYNIVTNDSLYRFIYHEDIAYSFTEVVYDWSGSNEMCLKYNNCEASENFYTLDNLDVNKLIPPDKQVIRFPPGTTIIRNKYSLHPRHRNFLRSLLLETEMRGGLFDVEQGNVITNFNHEIRGWFGVCMVLTDTIQFSLPL
jgi:hypothetical protein